VEGTELTFIAVGTPSGKDGSTDLAYIRKASQDIGKSLKGKKAHHTVVMKSTVLPGTCDEIVVPLIERHSGKKSGDGFGMAMNPEFLKEGLAIDDFLNPDRIVLGGNDGRSMMRLEKLYRGFSCPKMRTDLRTAEMIKYASNAFLARRYHSPTSSATSARSSG